MALLWRKWRVAVWLVFGILVLASPYSIAPWFVRDDPLATADAIIVLGGEARPPNRTIHALELYRRGVAPIVVFVGGALPNQPPELSSAYRSRREGLARGLPAGAALLVDGAQSTYDEATLVRDEAQRQGWRSLVVVTDPYHTRRSFQTFRAVIPEARITTSVAPFINPCTAQPRCTLFQWRYAASEAIKMIVYWVWYGVPWWN